MKNNKKICLFLVLIFGVSVGSTLSAQPLHPEGRRGGDRGQGQWHMVASDSLRLLVRLYTDSRLIEKIKLSAVRQKQLQAIHFQHEKQMITLRAKMRTLEIDLKSEMDKKNTRKYQALKIFRQIQHLWDNEKEKEFLLLFKITAILTKNQQSVLQQFLSNEKASFRRGFEHRDFN